MKRFGEIVKGARLAKDFSLKDLADKTKTYKGYICGIETGSLNPPSPKMVLRLCAALGLDSQQMLARSVFEKLPKGLRFYELEEILVEANREGLRHAKGALKI